MNSDIATLPTTHSTSTASSTTSESITTSDPHNIKEAHGKTRKISDAIISNKPSRSSHKKLLGQNIHHLKPSQDHVDLMDISPRKNNTNDSPVHRHSKETIVKRPRGSSIVMDLSTTDKNKFQKTHKHLKKKNEIRLTNQKNMSHTYQCLQKLKNDPELSLSYDSYGYLYCYRCESLNTDLEKQKLFARLFMEINLSSFLKNSMFSIREGTHEGIVSLGDIDSLALQMLPEKDEYVRLIRSEVRKMMHWPFQQNRNYVDERLENQKSLNHIYQCINRINAAEGTEKPLTLQLDAFGYLTCQPLKKPIDYSQKQKVLIHLYMTINSAICLKNMAFYGCKKAIADQHNLEELVKLETLVNMINKQNIFSNDLIEVVRSSVLKLLELSSEPEQHIYLTPKDIMPVEKPNLPINVTNSAVQEHPQTQKIKYNERSKSEMELIFTLQEKHKEFNELVERVQKYVDEPEITLYHKIEKLSHFKSELEDYLMFLEFHRSWTVNKYISEKVLKLCNIDKNKIKIVLPNDANPILTKLVEEIDFLCLGVKFYTGKNVEKTVNENPVNVEQFLSSTPFSEVFNPTIQKDFMQIVHEMKFYAAQTFGLITMDVLKIYKHSNFPLEPARYSKLLKSFVFKSFNHVISKYSKGKKDDFKKEFLNLYALFIKMIFELIQLNDFHSAYPICFALRDSSIEWIVERNPVPLELQKMHAFVFETLDSGFNHLAKKFDELRLNKVYHVPYGGFFIQYIEQKVGSLEGEEKAMEIKNLKNYLRYQRFNFGTVAEHICIRTDIYHQIYSSENITMHTPDLKLTQ